MLLPHLEWSVNPSSTAPSLLALFTCFWLMELLMILGNGSKSNGLPHGVLTTSQLKKWSLGYSLGSPLEVLRCVGHVRQYGSSAVPSPLAQQGTPCICTCFVAYIFFTSGMACAWKREHCSRFTVTGHASRVFLHRQWTWHPTFHPLCWTCCCTISLTQLEESVSQLF